MDLGESGGPITVARQICHQLSEQNVSTKILCGVSKLEVSGLINGVMEQHVPVYSLNKKYELSSKTSLRMLKSIIRNIRISSLVHLHFSRDLTSIFSAIFALLINRPLILQTHGMVVKSSRYPHRIIDYLFVKHILIRCKVILVLTEVEQNALPYSDQLDNVVVFPNFISVDEVEKISRTSVVPVIGFCGRIHKDKGVKTILEIAETTHELGLTYEFQIYGPDGGELEILQEGIRVLQDKVDISYKGALEREQVKASLAAMDVLVVPSEYDPFPMIVLEALSVGTPVVVSSICGNAPILRTFRSTFVVDTPNVFAYCQSIIELLSERFDTNFHLSIQDFCKTRFSAKNGTEELIRLYSLVIARK